MALPRQPVQTLTPQSIDRDRQLAQLLLGQAQQQRPQGIGSLIGGLAQTLAGQRRFERASAGEEQLRQQQRNQLAQVLSGLPGGGTTTGGVGLADILSSSNPALQNVGIALLQSRLQPGAETFEPITDEAGRVIAQRNTRTGQVVADPRAPDLFSPAELEQQIALAQARQNIVNVNTGTQTEIGRLVADREALITAGAPPDAPSVMAIDRRIAQIGAPDEPDTVSANEAGRIAMIEGGASALQTVIGSVFPQGLDQPADSQAIVALSLNVGSTGRLARSNLREVISTILRLETGAAQTEEEVDDALARFAPSVLDDDATVRDKLTRLQTRLTRAQELVRPGSLDLTGGLSPEDQAELDALRRAQGAL